MTVCFMQWNKGGGCGAGVGMGVLACILCGSVQPKS